MPEASDFRYYMHDGSAAFSFELAGRLSDEGARELQQTWQTASSMIGNRSLIVDLSYVTASMSPVRNCSADGTIGAHNSWLSPRRRGH